MESGKLVLSLDFELLWGIFDKVDSDMQKNYFANTRAVIPKILDLFQKYGVNCTWASVGMLFNKNWSEWEDNFPEILPSYNNINLNAYRFGQQRKEENSSLCCFAPDLIQKIINTPGQELATHTYSHYYCSEKGQTPEAFKADLKKAVEMAKALGVDLHSLVFPRNQLNETYLEICWALGIKTVRSNPSNWYWRGTENSSLLKRIFRTGDAYIGWNDKSYKISELKFRPGLPLQQRASRLLRPHSSFNFLNRARLRRVKSEMTWAARNEKIYHLWWHPHNFGKYPEKSLAELGELLDHFKSLTDTYDFKSCTMKGIEELVVKQEKILK